MTQSWDEAIDSYGHADTGAYDDRIRDADGPREERDAVDAFLTDYAPDATGETAVEAVVVGLDAVPSSQAVVAATGVADADVARVRERLQHDRRRAQTDPDCRLHRELTGLDDPKAIASRLRYYFEGVVDGHWLETAAIGWRGGGDASREGMGDIITEMLDAHAEFDLVQADQLVLLTRGLGIEEAVVGTRPRDATSKAVTVLEAGLRRYAERELAEESTRDTVARLKIRFPRIDEREWGTPVYAHAAETDAETVRRVDVATNPGGVEVDPIRREAIEHDAGACVRCDATAAIAHRVLPPADVPATLPEGHACLCEDCYWEAHTETEHRRRYETTDEFWEWAKAPNTSL